MNTQVFVCEECGCCDGYVIPQSPWVIECLECGHPGDFDSRTYLCT